MKNEILSRLILEHVKVPREGKAGNYIQFVSYKMTLWLALPSWLLKVHTNSFVSFQILKLILFLLQVSTFLSLVTGLFGCCSLQELTFFSLQITVFCCSYAFSMINPLVKAISR